jgi:hypothetical protein
MRHWDSANPSQTHSMTRQFETTLCGETGRLRAVYGRMI